MQNHVSHGHAPTVIVWEKFFLLWKETNYVRTISRATNIFGWSVSVHNIISPVSFCFTSLLKCSAHVTRIICHIKNLFTIFNGKSKHSQNVPGCYQFISPDPFPNSLGSGGARCCQPDTTTGSSSPRELRGGIYRVVKILFLWVSPLFLIDSWLQSAIMGYCSYQLKSVGFLKHQSTEPLFMNSPILQYLSYTRNTGPLKFSHT